MRHGVGYLVVRVGVGLLRVGLIKICCGIGWVGCLIELLGLCILLASCPCWFWFCDLVFGFDIGLCLVGSAGSWFVILRLWVLVWCWLRCDFDGFV